MEFPPGELARVLLDREPGLAVQAVCGDADEHEDTLGRPSCARLSMCTAIAAVAMLLNYTDERTDNGILNAGFLKD